MKKLLLSLTLVTLIFVYGCASNAVTSAKNMVLGKSGKSLDMLLNEHPLVEKGSVKWGLDGTTNAKSVVLQFRCFTVSKDVVQKHRIANPGGGYTTIMNDSLDNDRMERASSQLVTYKITFVVSGQTIRVIDANVDGQPLRGDASLDMFISNLEKPEKDYINFISAYNYVAGS